jgi:tRNA pseudouridine38-40 synthase
MRFFKLVLAYDGTAYCGWQVQAGEPTIQAALEAALARVTGENVRAVASGRTDAGVHALGQVVSLSLQSRLEPSILQRALNANLPPDIRVREVVEAAVGFHAIRSARWKRYRYLIQDGGVSDVFRRRYCWFVSTPLDIGAMQQGAALLLGTHDFASFQSAGSPRANTVRCLREFTVQRRDTELARQIVVDLVADGFLYNMVRNLVGTLVQVGRGVESTDWPARVLAAKDRRRAGPAAPAQGLFLVEVECAEG